MGFTIGEIQITAGLLLSVLALLSVAWAAYQKHAYIQYKKTVWALLGPSASADYDAFRVKIMWRCGVMPRVAAERLAGKNRRSTDQRGQAWPIK